MIAENWVLDGPTIETWLKVHVVPFFYTWYSAALLVLTIFNFKLILWMIRTYRHGNAAVEDQRRDLVAPHIGDGGNTGVISKENALESIEQHPLFQPVVINTDVEQLDIDLSLYKLNSTFFSDLEVSRIKLMGQIIAPAWPMDDMEIEYKGRDGKDKKEKVKGRPALILGATYTSFKRELRPHAAYTIESRILGWDSRWIYVGSWFHDKASSKKKVDATSLSKYIIKKGRITVHPEQFFTECGWISAQDKHDDTDDEMASNEKILSSSEFEAHKEKSLDIIRTWNEAIVLMEQEYED